MNSRRKELKDKLEEEALNKSITKTLEGTELQKKLEETIGKELEKTLNKI